MNQISKIFYGGDYNPEQWTRDVWLEDMRLMKLAGVNLVTVGVFSWARLQSGPDTFDFQWLDDIMDLLYENGISVDLATGTASPPAWLVTQHPDVLPVDETGVRYAHGSRQHYCPNSRTYREMGQKLVRRLAERYKNHPALAMWHVNNEYGCHVSQCYCSQCQRDFRSWLEKRYENLENLNANWGTDFWSQYYYSWDEIDVPRKTPTFANPGQQLDYARFMSDSLLEDYLGEMAILRDVTPEVPVLTNFMGTFKPLDYFQWAPHLDVVSWDSYPEPLGGTPVGVAMTHDLMRSLRQGQPFLLMEQTPSQVNWRQQNPLKRPGIMRLWSYQTIARGGDGILFFQWRASRAGAEKYHGAMVSHLGDERGRVFSEVRDLGQELQTLSVIAGSQMNVKTAIVFDWSNWWALELDSKPSQDVRYLEQVFQYYQPLYQNNIAVDFVQPEGDWSNYEVVIAPALYMTTAAAAENIEAFVNRGGLFITNFFSGIVDESDRVHLGGYPALIKHVLGITVEEFDPIPSPNKNRIRIAAEEKDVHSVPAQIVQEAGLTGEYGCSLWADLIQLEGAHSLAEFMDDFYQGRPAVTVHGYGSGLSVYVGTQCSEGFLSKLLPALVRRQGVHATAVVPDGVEATKRVSEESEFWFYLNHNSYDVEVKLPSEKVSSLVGPAVTGDSIILSANDVAVLKAR